MQSPKEYLFGYAQQFAQKSRKNPVQQIRFSTCLKQKFENAICSIIKLQNAGKIA
jgi:hypothetical protein